jgi:ABC-type Mn2+/Zn2+ transport system permease subunit
MIELLTLGFMQRALAAGVMVSLICSLLSFFIVLKRLSFIGVGVSHSAFGGVALGFLLGINPTLTAMVFAVATALAISHLKHHQRVQEDVAIGIFFSAAMSLGVIFVGLSRGYTVDLFGYLFGSILAVTSQDLWVIGTVSIIVISLVLLLFRYLLFISFDEEMARVSGLPVTMLNDLLLVCIAITVIVSIKIVGIILVSALLVIPGAASYQLTKNYRSMLIGSLVVGFGSSLVGLLLSYRLDLASGATIVIVATAIFFVSAVLSPRRRRASS